MDLPKTTDFLIIGGGIVGITVALELARRLPTSRITLIEKEDQVARHASGRNSGVLHAGFYYTADSLKARFTREGRARMQAYVEGRGLKINRCGKLVVAKNEAELAGLDELLRRGKANGVELYKISEREAKQIEPRVKTSGWALFSPTTAAVDPMEVTLALAEDAQAAGVQILTGTRYLLREGKYIRTNRGRIEAMYVINAAGLYADQIARDFGFSQRYRILPFKGLYLLSSESPGAVRTHVYPVPDLKNPFLGVHFTVTVTGKVKIGPTATPAFWREHYGGLAGFNPGEFASILLDEFRLFLRAEFDFRRLALEELKKYYRPYLVSQAQALLEGVRPEQYRTWGRPGIRAQLYDVQERKLVMDFHLEGDDTSLHILNAVSPAFTASMAFAEYVVDRVEQLVQA